MRTPTSTAYVLRVRRKLAGSAVPFDRIYLFQKQDQPMLPKIFANAMVFMLTKKFADQILKVIQIDSPGTHGFSYVRGDDTRLATTVPGVADIVTNQRNNYVALVPVLFTKTGHKRIENKRPGRKKDPSYPAYLVARSTDVAIHGLASALSSKAYFILDEKEVRPICLACPLHQNFIQGQCHIGETDCYRFLARAVPGDLVRGLRLYAELTKRAQEPLLESGLSDG